MSIKTVFHKGADAFKNCALDHPEIRVHGANPFSCEFGIPIDHTAVQWFAFAAGNASQAGNHEDAITYLRSARNMKWRLGKNPK